MPPPTHAAPSANNPYLRALRDELEKQRRSILTTSLHPLIDALDRHCAEQDRRIASLEGRIQTVLAENLKDDQRIRDLERQVADLSDVRSRPQLAYGGTT